MIAKFYEQIDEKQIRCLLCENRCLLREEARGRCRVNMNFKGELKCLVFGRMVAVAVDPIEKKPFKKFLSGTKAFSLGSFGCNMHCDWCQNHSISQNMPADISSYDYYDQNLLIALAKKYDCASVAYTYNEPTVFYLFAREVGKLAKKNNLKNLFVSNGYQTPEVLEDMESFVDAINVDLKAFSEQTYLDYTGAKLEIVKRNLKLIAKSKIHLEISTLIIPGLNDSRAEIDAMIEFISNELGRETPWHLAAFYPNYKMLYKNPTAPSEIIELGRYARKQGLKNVFLGNI